MPLRVRADLEPGGEYVFISYARSDRAFVERLTAALRSAGVASWTDLENIPAGARWEEAIERGVQGASALVYVASKSSSSSGWMDHELGAMIAAGRPVFPVVVDDEGAERLPAPLRAIQFADFRVGFDVALRSLLGGLGRLQRSGPVPSPVPASKGYAFISYADEDAAFVGELKAFLKQKRYGYWDFRESKRDFQLDYTLELERIIREAAATLSVVSPEWKRSRTALQELHFSREVGTPVFLLWLRDPGPTLAIAGATHIEFIRRPADGFAQLDAEMRSRGL